MEESIKTKTISLEIDDRRYKVPLESELTHENGFSTKCSLQEELHEWFWHDLYTLLVHHKSNGWETITAYDISKMSTDDLRELSKFAPNKIGVTLLFLAMSRE